MKKRNEIPDLSEVTTNDSVRRLRLLRFFGGQITRSPTSVSVLSNGLPYFFVEVTSDDGSQYGITAYGDEANELHKEVVRTEEIAVVLRTRPK